MLKLTMNGLVLPSLNTWQRMHRMARWRLKIDVAYYILAARGRRRTRAQGRRARVLVKQYRPRLIKDFDNLAASIKPLMDGLVKTELLVDDSMQWVDVKLEQHRAGQEGARVEVLIEYLEA